MVAIEMSCACGANLSLTGDKEETEQLWHLTHRFTAAHTVCGFVKPPSVEQEATRKFKRRVIKPFNEEDDE
jgi:hypothetical protein